MRIILLSIYFSFLFNTGFAQPIPADSLYLGQTPPGNIPKIFPLPVASGYFAAERIAISPDGKEIYYSETNGYSSTSKGRIKVLHYSGNKWNNPVILFENIGCPAFSANGKYWGAYNGKEIKLATPEEAVFFHELSHHAHKLVLGELVPGQDWKQEIVAELSAEALSRIFGLKTTTGNSYKYIEGYAAQAGLSPVTGCLQVLSDTEKVLKLILEEDKPEIKMADGV